MLSSTISSGDSNRISSEDSAGALSRCLFLYLDKLLATGSKKTLSQEDLGAPSLIDRSSTLYSSFVVQWDLEMKKPRRKQSLWSVLIRIAGLRRYLTALSLYGLYVASIFGPVLILNALVKYFEGTENLTTSELWILVLLLLFIPCIGSICSAQYTVIMAHMGVQFRNVLVAVLFRKCLVLSPEAHHRYSTGKIVNMFSNDTGQLQKLMYQLGILIFAPIQIAVCLALIYLRVGNATWVGVGFMLALMPINVFIVGSVKKIRKLKLNLTDSRVKLLNEIFSGIRVIKFYAWEDSLQLKVDHIRKEELSYLEKLAYMVVLRFTAIALSAPVMLPILVFYAYIRMGNQLDAATAFTTLTLFYRLRQPFTMVPTALTQYSQALVSLKRMSEFLTAGELQKYVIDHSSPDPEPKMDSPTAKDVDVNHSPIIIEHSSTKPEGVIASDVDRHDPLATGQVTGDQNLQQQLCVEDGQEVVVRLQGASLGWQSLDLREPTALASNQSFRKSDGMYSLEAGKDKLRDTSLSIDKLVMPKVACETDIGSTDEPAFFDNPMASRERANGDSNGKNNVAHELESGGTNEAEDHHKNVENPVHSTIPLPAPSASSSGSVGSSVNANGDHTNAEHSDRSIATPSGAEARDANLQTRHSLRMGRVPLIAVGMLTERRNSVRRRHDEKTKSMKDMNNITTTSSDLSTRADEFENELESNTTNQQLFINRSLQTLVNLDLVIKKGQLVAVVGPVGSGKSSLLNSLLGELHLHSGSVMVRGQVAYCDQRPWMLNATVKDNILFGLPYNSSKFYAAMHSAALDEDMLILPGGVKTQLGERGVNLSGGQKARVALARAVYRDADVYLLDDPLSAVDAHVGQYIFEKCIVRDLAGKTRILVTHHVHLLKQCDLVVVLEGGHIKASGTFAELQHANVDIEAYVHHLTEKEEAEMAEAIQQQKEQEQRALESATTNRVEDMASPCAETSNSTDVSVGRQDSRSYPPAPACIREAIRKKSRISFWRGRRDSDVRSSEIMTEEERYEGSVKTDTYLFYVNAGGMWLYVFIFVAMCVSKALDLGSSFWLSYWSAVTVRRSKEGSPLSSADSLEYLNIYALISMLCVGALMTRSLLLVLHRIGTSARLHHELLSSVLIAPISFFDMTPIGRILNRFSSDMIAVDEDLTQSISQLLYSAFQVIGSLIAIAAATQGTFLALLCPLCLLYYRIQKYYRKSSTEIQRLMNISLSPIYADFSQALVGLSTIRAYRLTDQFINHMEASVDKNTTSAVMSQLVSQWLAIRLDLISAVVSFFIAALGAAAGSEFLPAGYLGLALAFALDLSVNLKMTVKLYSTAEMQMNSVERIKHYTKGLEREGWVSEGQAPPPAEWPSAGAIVAKDVSLSYGKSPPVLHDISLSILSGEKIGIVGRSGAGKSSVLSALFRMVELSSGSICIDGVDCSKIPIKLLRSRIGIIPQESVMFSASLRFNIDPFNRCGMGYADYRLV